MDLIYRLRAVLFFEALYLAQHAETETERKKYRDIYFKLAAKIVGEKPLPKQVKVDELFAGKVLRKAYGDFVVKYGRQSTDGLSKAS